MEKNFFEGIITKAVGGSYYVAAADNVNNVISCTARGIFRKNNISPCAGDRVTVILENKNQPVIDKIHERKNHIIRPPLSNLDLALIVTSACNPAPNTLVTDKLISIFESKGIEPIIIITKSDLQSCDEFAEIYRNCGFKVIYMDNITGEGAEQILPLISGKLSALIGNSGVGKSSLMKILFPDITFNTAEISRKLGRGRHTTREAGLYPLKNGGFIADTPGFSSVEVSRYGHIPKNELQYSFREFAPYLDKCRFNDCAHLKESGCAVLNALSEGKISASRHDSYRQLYEQADKIKEWELNKK